MGEQGARAVDLRKRIQAVVDADDAITLSTPLAKVHHRCIKAPGVAIPCARDCRP